MSQRRLRPPLNSVSRKGDAAKFTIRCGLDTTDCVGRAMASSVALRCHAWLCMTGFSEDVQANLMDMPFDGTQLFVKKADSALERFKENRATTRSLGLSTAPDRTRVASGKMVGHIVVIVGRRHVKTNNDMR